MPRRTTANQVNARGWRMDGIMREDVRQACGYKRRQAVRYNDAENQDLIAQHAAGARIEDMAEWHERTENGIGGQLMRLGCIPADGPLWEPK